MEATARQRWMIEIAHYNVWANRLEGALRRAYPRTRWRVLRFGELWIARTGQRHPPDWFRVVARTFDGDRRVYALLGITHVLDEERFDATVRTAGVVLERALAEEV